MSVRSLIAASAREVRAIAHALRCYRDTTLVRRAYPETREVESTLPVVLVHGSGHNASAWRSVAERLDAAGFGALHPVEYGIGDSLPAISARIAQAAHFMLDRCRAPRVHVVAHSLGGVATQMWHDWYGGATLAGATVTLGTPHQGTNWARLPMLPRPVRELVPGSRLIRALTASRVNHSRWTTIAGTLDVLVPSAAAHLPSSYSVDVEGIGHVGLLTSRVVGGQVCFALLAAEESRRVVSR